MLTVVAIGAGEHFRRVLARRDRLVCENFGLVRPIAERIMLRLPPSFELDDLMQTGHLGLMQAATRYRPGKHDGTPFSAYARPVIRGKILDSVRRRHYLENTRVEITDREDFGEIGRDEPVELAIDRGRLVRRADFAREYLTSEQSEVVAAYYSPRMPSLASVAATLGIPEQRAMRAHTEALEVLRRILHVA
jgi:RNA polymerase sigma factor (sigma-70 family)